MSVPLFALTGLTLVLLTSVATLPELLRVREPRARDRPPQETVAPWLVVRSGGGGWFLHGAAVAEPDLARRLPTAPPGGTIRFLASAALTSGEVSRSLAWLRGRSRDPVLLELAPTRP